MLGEQNTESNGIKYTNYTKVNYWSGDIPHYGDSLYLDGKFDPKKLTVTAYTPYEHFAVTKFDYIKKDKPSKFFADWFWPSIGTCLICLYGIKYYLKIIII